MPKLAMSFTKISERYPEIKTAYALVPSWQPFGTFAHEQSMFGKLPYMWWDEDQLEPYKDYPVIQVTLDPLATFRDLFPQATTQHEIYDYPLWLDELTEIDCTNVSIVNLTTYRRTLLCIDLKPN